MGQKFSKQGGRLLEGLQNTVCYHFYFLECLNVGTVPTYKMHNIGTVPTFKMYNVGTVPMFEMHNVGTPKIYDLCFELEFGLYKGE